MELEIQQDVKDAFAKLIATTNTINYIICSYVPGSNGTKLKVTDTGNDGIAGVVDEERDGGEILSDGQIRYIVVKLHVDGIPKLCQIAWRGKNAKGMLGSKTVMHANQLDKDLFHSHHLFITDNQEEVTEEKILAGLRKAKGVSYGSGGVSTSSYPGAACARCSAELKLGAKFCSNCGAPVK